MKKHKESIKSGSPGTNLAARLERTLPEDLIRPLRELGRTGSRLGLKTYAVGGFVRDLFLNRKNLDLDVVVEGRGGAIRLGREFSKSSGSTFQPYPRFGTATLTLTGGYRIDLASTRVESYPSPASLPQVKPGTLEQDLFRRDFTINTLAVDLHPRRFGMLIDHFGARADIRGRKISVIHPASFIDDPTRIFRALRFEQRLGFRIDPITLSLLKDAIRLDMLSRLSGTRLLAEIKHCLRLEQVIPLLARMDRLGVLTGIHPALGWNLEIARRMRGIQSGLQWFTDKGLAECEPDLEWWLPGFLALTSRMKRENLENLVARLKLSRHTSEKIFVPKGTERVLSRLSSSARMKPSTIFRLLSPFAPETLLAFRARTRSATARKRIQFYLSHLARIKIGTKGSDLKRLGIRPGPVYGEIFRTLLDLKLNGRLCTKEEEVSWAKKSFDSG